MPLRTCSDTVFFNRQRPCLEYEIKRCAGPCCLPVDRADYQRWLRQAEAILQGKSRSVIDELTRQMNVASENLFFEEAAFLRDKIAFLEKFASEKHLVSFQGEDRDVFAIYRESTLVSVSVLFVRNGRVAGNRNFSFTDVIVSDEELLAAVLQQFYEKQAELPPEIILPQSIEEDTVIQQYLGDLRGAAFNLVVPKKGIRYRLLQLAELNAKQHFIERFNTQDRNSQMLSMLAEMFSLKQVPRRIECVDISNFQGTDIVASVVAFTDGIPDKEGYKRYKVRAQGKPDDFASIYEIVSRRVDRGKKEEDLPDLFV
ncbi:MAG: UvrB/UvrC motif-containing protein, partial [Bdellovibrionales bacterium]|nr:UvrB/UvrC motif-containing protein [Bdellovibrionales bacterium]